MSVTKLLPELKEILNGYTDYGHTYTTTEKYFYACPELAWQRINKTLCFYWWLDKERNPKKIINLLSYLCEKVEFDVNIENEYGFTILGIFISRGYSVRHVEEFIETFQPNLQKGKKSLLRIAIGMQNPYVIQLLMKKGAQLTEAEIRWIKKNDSNNRFFAIIQNPYIELNEKYKNTCFECPQSLSKKFSKMSLVEIRDSISNIRDKEIISMIMDLRIVYKKELYFWLFALLYKANNDEYSDIFLDIINIMVSYGWDINVQKNLPFNFHVGSSNPILVVSCATLLEWMIMINVTDDNIKKYCERFSPQLTPTSSQRSSALILAVLFNRYELIQFFIAKGVNIHHNTWSIYTTALTFAKNQRNIDVRIILLLSQQPRPPTCFSRWFFKREKEIV